MSRIFGEGAGASRHNRAAGIRPLFHRRHAATSFVVVTAGLAVSALGGCASSGQSVMSSSASPMFPESKWGVSASRRVAGHNERIPKGGGTYKVGAPYKVGGRWYQPREQPNYDRVGVASWYGSDFHGRHTSNGEIFDMHALTAAHPTLPMPSYAYVTNLSNNRTILVRINDRGPYVGDRMIDLSRASADALGLRGRGTGRVRVRYAGPAPLDGNDSRERQFAATRSWNGGGTDIAAVERAVSAHEHATYQNSAKPRPTAWRPPQFEQRTASIMERQPPVRAMGRDPDLPYGQTAYQQPRYAQAYAEQSVPSDGLWSPERYRAASNRTR